MEQNVEGIQTLLNQAAELGHMMFWCYNCNSGELTLSDPKILFFQDLPPSASQLENQKEFDDYMHSIFPEKQETFKNIIQGKATEQKGIFHYKLQKNKTIHYHCCKYHLLNTNNSTLILGTIADETDKIQTQQKFREKESVFEHIATYSNIGIFSWKPLTDEAYISPLWYQNFGLPPDTPLRQAMHMWSSRIHPQDYNRVKSAGEQLRNGQIKYLNTTFRLIVNDEIRWLQYSVALKNYDLVHNDIQIVGTNQDITEKKLQEERNSKIIEALPDFIFIFDREFYIRDIFKSTTVSLLHSTEELMNADGRNFYSPEVSQLYSESINRCLSEQELQEIEYPLDVPSGRYYFQARLVPFGNHRVMALIHDITEKMNRTQEIIAARNKAEEADRMKSNFLANMSHEIRTPLNAIVGFSDLLTNTDDPEEKKMYNEIIHTNSNLLLQLINDVLDLSRIESGKTEILLKETNMNNLLQEVGQVHLLKMPENIKLNIECPEENIQCLTDHNKVTQVLFNFMSNAIKNTRQGSILLKMSLEGNNIRLSVKDTGVGIPKDKLNHIFERFMKINDFIQGTGLGLSICRTIADKLHGHIEVESELGKGSCFSLLLPLHP